MQDGNADRGSPNSIPSVAAVQTAESGEPDFMYFSQWPFTKETLQAFAEQSLAAPANLVSDDLGYFKAVGGIGILHKLQAADGRATSAKHLAFLAVNTALGNLKTWLAGADHAFGFRNCTHHCHAQVQHLFVRRFDLRGPLELDITLTACPCRSDHAPMAWPSQQAHAGVAPSRGRPSPEEYPCPIPKPISPAAAC